MQSQNLYFLAIIPHGKVAGEITAFKQHIALHYNSIKALRVIPHITLKAPFKVPSIQHDTVISWFNSLKTVTAPFTISLKNFGCFNNPHNPVIYVRPEISESLSLLQQDIITAFQTAFPDIALYGHEQGFSPHITIAYRDLPYETFEKAWEEFKNKPYEAFFEVHSLFLLQHDGTKWNVASEKSLF